jgi:hypothetical protein
VNTTASTTFTITVQPALDLSTIFDREYCVGASIAEETLSATSTWRQWGSNIGLSTMSGTGSIPAFTATNTTSQSQIAFFEIIPASGSCQGQAVTYKITVAPEIRMVTATDMGEVCSDLAFRYTAASNVNNAAIRWTRPAVVGINNGLPADGIGANINEVLTNHTDVPIQVQYYITMTSGDCTNTDSVEVVVNPTPVFTSSQPIIVGVCIGEATVDIPYTLNAAQAGMDINYSLNFNENALISGFVNVSDATLSGGVITVALPSSIVAGNYSGTLSLSSNGCTGATTYSITIQVTGGVQITQQPQSPGGMCGSASTVLSVVATGTDLTYQWYFEGAAIDGATSSTYTASEFGEYYVVVTGSCGSSQSDVVTIESIYDNLLVVKWDDVILVDNTEKDFVAYQWYRDGRIIPGATGQWYQELGGLNGTYYARVTTRDGRVFNTCDTTLMLAASVKSMSISIYPNPAYVGQKIQAILSGRGNNDVVRCELHNALGALVQSFTVNSDEFTIDTYGLSSGVYVCARDYSGRVCL